MKKALITVIAATIVLMVGNLYAQPVAESGITPVQTTYTLKDYLATSKQDSDAFLRSVNIEDTYYNNSPMTKVGAGVNNTATCYMDVPLEVAKVSEEQNAFTGWTAGLVGGIGKGLVRGASGIAEIVTSPLPPYDKPMIKTDYQTEDPNKEYQVKLLQW